MTVIFFMIRWYSERSNHNLEGSFTRSCVRATSLISTFGSKETPLPLLAGAIPVASFLVGTLLSVEPHPLIALLIVSYGRSEDVQSPWCGGKWLGASNTKREDEVRILNTKAASLLEQNEMLCWTIDVGL